jgi:hypothetical protein
MSLSSFYRVCRLLPLLAVAACGGGGGTEGPAMLTLESIALSPLRVSLAPGATQQLTVTGTYSGGTTQVLSASDETFTSSDTNVATVSAAGVVTVAAGATVGATATVSATDNASGIATAAGASTVVTVSAAASSGPPTANSLQAAKATATDNALCTAIVPFYWEIGDKTGALASGTFGTDAQGNPISGATRFSVASASKLIYGAYIVQIRGSAAALTAQDINFMHFTSGYTNMGDVVNSSECPTPADGSPDTVNACLALTNPANGLPYSYQNPQTEGTFDYDSGHLENHASLYGGLGDVPVAQLGPMIADELATNITFLYTEPLMAGGIFTSSDDYTTVLRNILSGALAMRDALGTSPVCTRPSAPGCNATFSPIPEAWHYSIAHWVEDDPSTNGDGAFSSPGAFGFYPWIDAQKTYYGVISREASSGNGEQQGYASAQCGRLIRHAWDTGVEQTGAIPQ